MHIVPYVWVWKSQESSAKIDYEQVHFFNQGSTKKIFSRIESIEIETNCASLSSEHTVLICTYLCLFLIEVQVEHPPLLFACTAFIIMAATLSKSDLSLRFYAAFSDGDHHEN